MFSSDSQAALWGSMLLLALLVGPAQADDLLRDPTRPPASVESVRVAPLASGSWTLSSVLFSPQRRVATINGKTVQEGDRVDDARVLRIEAAAVYLQAGSRQLKLLLTPGQIKRPARHVGREPGES